MKRQVIAFIGRQGSGKSYHASKFVKERGFKKLSFADPLREIAFNIIGIDFEEGMKQYAELKKTEIINGLNFRNILENLGASVRKFDEDFWARALLCKIKECAEHIVIDDMRYVNEYQSVKNYCASKGYEFKAYFCNFQSDVYDANNKHESARMANYLAQIGYEDCQLIKNSDIFSYASLIGATVNAPVEDSATSGNLDIKQKGEEVLHLLKGFGK